MSSQVTNTYLSDRGYALTYYGKPPCTGGKPILTIENYTKWYSLYVIESDGRARKLDPDKYEVDLAKMDSPMTEWADHVPHPDYYAYLCRHHGFQRDESAYQLILGRYIEEITWGGERGDKISETLGIKSLHSDYLWE